MHEAIKAALLRIAIETVAVLVMLVFSELIEWFINVAQVLDDQDLAFTLKTEMNRGRYTIVQGVFDQRTDQVKKARRIEAERVDARIRSAHESNALVVYT